MSLSIKWDHNGSYLTGLLLRSEEINVPPGHLKFSGHLQFSNSFIEHRLGNSTLGVKSSNDPLRWKERISHELK